MTTLTNLKNYVLDEPRNSKTNVGFTGVKYLGKPTFKLDPGILTLSWPPGDDNATVDYFFHYIGQQGLLMIPYGNLFVAKDGNDQMFELTNTDKNKGITKIVLRSRADIMAAGYPTDGTLVFVYTVYNYEENTLAIGNSPPKMELGP